MAKQVHVVHYGRGHWVSFDNAATGDQIEAAVRAAYPGGVVTDIKTDTFHSLGEPAQGPEVSA